MSSNPVLAEVWRGSFLECVHHGAVAITRPDGSLLFAAGDTREPMLPRSSVKPFQAIAMLRSGLDLEGAELALGAASHAGEPFHLEAALRILDGAGLTVDDLQNTPGLPTDDQARNTWLASGHGEERLAHNCSGKHAAMVRTCVRSGWPLDGYLSPGHPLQRAAREVIAEFSGEEIPEPLVDGCGAPAFAVSVEGLARAFGSLASAASGEARLLADAFRTHPEYASGTRRDEVVLHREVTGLVCKAGAEGSFGIGLPDGTGIAVKISDGHHRGTVPVVVAALRALGLSTPALEALDPEPVLGHGAVVGRVVASGELLEGLRQAQIH